MQMTTSTWYSNVVVVVAVSCQADDQSYLHCVIVSTDVMSDNTERRDASRGGGCSKISAYKGQFGWSSMIWSILSVAALRCREGGATLLSTGSHESCVGCRQPEIRCIALENSVLRLSSKEPRLMCRECLALAPHEVPASFAIRLFLLFSLTAQHDRCSLYERVWSSVVFRCDTQFHTAGACIAACPSW